MCTHLLQSDVFFRGTLGWGNLSVCAEVQFLLQSGVFIISSFSCQAFTLKVSHLFHWQSEQSVCSCLSLPLSQPFLLSLVCLWQRRSFPSFSREAGSLPPPVFKPGPFSSLEMGMRLVPSSPYLQYAYLRYLNKKLKASNTKEEKKTKQKNPKETRLGPLIKVLGCTGNED